MKKHPYISFFNIFPGFVTLLAYFIPSLTYPMKLIIPLLLSTLYFIGLGLLLQIKLNRSKSNFLTLKNELRGLKHDNENLNERLYDYHEFVHRRELFINHDLIELQTLINEYEGYVKNCYRGNKYQEMRSEAGSIKKRFFEIINKEKRDFDEQLYKFQSYKDN